MRKVESRRNSKEYFFSEGAAAAPATCRSLTMFPAKKTPIPLAPAPIRGGPTGQTSFGAVPASTAKGTAEEGLSSSSSDDDLHLVRPATNAGGKAPRATGLYAELGEEDGEDNEDEAGVEEEFEVEEPGGEEATGADRDELIRERIAASQEQMKSILGSLTEEQLQRYETFRRVGFPRPMVKKVQRGELDERAQILLAS